MRCYACNKEFKTYRGFHKHLEKEAFDLQQRLDFQDQYREACKRGYKGTDGEYAWGRVTGQLDLLGKERADG